METIHRLICSHLCTLGTVLSTGIAKDVGVTKWQEWGGGGGKDLFQKEVLATCQNHSKFTTIPFEITS